MACADNNHAWTPAWKKINGKSVYGYKCANPGCGTFKEHK